MPDLRPLRIGVEIQLADLGGAGKAAGAAYGDCRGQSGTGGRVEGLRLACANGFCGREVNRLCLEQADIHPRRPDLLGKRWVVREDTTG